MESWSRITDSILERYHVKMPIEKRFFLSFLEEDRDHIQKQTVLDCLRTKGFLEDDPRLLQLRDKLRTTTGPSLSYEEFRGCVENHICILKQILRSELIVPRFAEFTECIRDMYEKTLDNTGGHNADYIPQLKRVDPDQYGISVCTVDGQRHNVGDTNTYFSVQSCCKPINYAIALETLGEECVHTYVGREPSGQAFNELLLNKKGRPHNPLINSGAIMTTSLLYPEKDMALRFEELMSTWQRLSGGIHNIGFNNSVYLSEKRTADRNYALAYFMKETNGNKPVGFPENTDLNETLELYFQSCSIEVTTESLSVVASTLANGGINPFTGERIFSPKTVQNVLSMMLTCGLYDYSGEFAFKIGIPAKSGVAGAVMIVIPNVMGIVTWSPRLDDIGNSVRGIDFCKRFGSQFNFHIFDNASDSGKVNPLAIPYENESHVRFSELCMASQQGDLDHLKILFNKGVDFNQSDYDQRTPLHVAVCEGHLNVCKFLIQVTKANIHKKDRWGMTPYAESEKSNNPELKSIFTSNA